MDRNQGRITDSHEKRTQLLAEIEEAQRESGYVSEEFMTATAEEMGLSVGEVYGVTTFYSFLALRPLGRNVIRICKSISCYLQNAEMITQAVREELDIGPGETSADGRFSYELTNCIGACDQAPAMLINDHVYGGLTPEKIAHILRSFK